jgi:hypothetical protein
MLTAVVIALVLVAAMTVLVVRQKNMHQWLGAYLRQRLAPARDSSDGPTHILFCFVDHYEPQWNNPDDIDRERARVDRWVRDYPKMASHTVDADGTTPLSFVFLPRRRVPRRAPRQTRKPMSGWLWRDRDSPAPRQRYGGESRKGPERLCQHAAPSARGAEQGS